MKTIHSTLIVDDSEADVFIVKHVMEKSGRYPYIFEARDGEEALELFLHRERARALHPDKFPPSLIFLDINMPRMSGFEFLEELAAIELPDGVEHSVIVMLSSSALDSDRERADAYDFVRDYVVKPLRHERAIEIAERWGTA